MCTEEIMEAIDAFCTSSHPSFINMQSSLHSIQHTCDCRTCGLKETTFCDMSNARHSNTHFTIWSIVEGHRVKTLADSGADTNFIDTAFANTLDVKPTPCRPRAIRLGNNSIHHINSCLVLETWVGQLKFKISYLVMPLPQGISTVLGMSHLASENALLKCKTRQIIYAPQGARKEAEIVSAAIIDPVPDLNDLQAMDSDPELVTKHSQKDTECAPLGLFSINEDADSNEIASVSKKVMRTLLSLMKQNKLTPNKANDIIEGKSKIHKNGDSVMSRHKIRKRTDLSGQDFVVKNGGDAAEADMLLSDIMSAASSTKDDDAEEIYFVELRNRPDGSFHFCDASGKPIPAADAAPASGQRSRAVHIMSTAVEEATRLASPPTEYAGNYFCHSSSYGTTPKSGNSANSEMEAAFLNAARPEIKFPSWFKPSEIDTTDELMMEWVRQLTEQILRKFGCMDAIKKWSPLPTDPLLKINLKQGKKGFAS
eukprot:SAG11_NODE_208_length_12354_cov_19.490167_17_plen_482_part_01